MPHNNLIRRDRLVFRARVLAELRRALDGLGYLEVETPARVRTPGTDVNLEAFASEDRWLITSPEFHMKRLLARGMGRIYQICRCWRRDESTDLHNSEFTMLEYYAPGLALEGLMEELEGLIRQTAARLGVGAVSYRGVNCDLRSPWVRMSVDQVFREKAGWSPLKQFDEERFYFDLVDKVDRDLGAGRPLILHGYPAPLAMLARRDPRDTRTARRFELYLAGVEIANAFEELTDHLEQRRRFEQDLETRRAQGKTLYPVDEALLQALPSMPPTSGIAVGVDRLVMLLCGAESVAEVMAFPDEEV